MTQDHAASPQPEDSSAGLAGAGDGSQAPAGKGRAAKVKKPRSRGRKIFYRVLLGILAVLLLVGAWASWSFYRAVQSSEGEPTEVLAATWARDHHLGFAVAKAEDLYYRYIETTPVGGTPTTDGGVDADSSDGVAAGGSASAGGTVSGATVVAVDRAHLNPPGRLQSPAGESLSKEGVWQPTKSTVDGIPAIYVAKVRPDGEHTSVFVSMMWIDTKLAKFGYVPGYEEPGGPSPTDGAMPEAWVPTALASFNGGFRLQDAQGGYYYKGQTIAPLVDGAASAVVYKNGDIKVGKWNRDVSMSSDIVSVRQNLDLIVDKGKAQTSGGSDGSRWGATTDGASLAWRSAIGQRADGSLLYIGSPSLSADALANTMVAAGAKRAMTLDMNNWWVAGFYYHRAANGDLVCKKLDPQIEEGCDRFLKRYKRDSFAVYARPETQAGQ